MKLPARLRWLWLTLGIVLADRATKAWFETQTDLGWRHEVMRHFIYLVHSSNPGIAFSLFADSHSPWLRILLTGGSLVVICALAWLLVAGQGGAIASAGLALLLGGATGNVTDRILHGAVTDFFEVWIGTYRWPAFNVADSAITIGAVLLILDLFFSPKETNSSQTKSHSSA
jgi:signal peptidase II